MSELVRKRTRLRNGWRAGYIERCTSGSEGGSRKPAVGIQQGGGFLPYKTTTAVSLAAGLAEASRQVLLIDLDPQAHCAISLGLKSEPGTYYLLNPGHGKDETDYVREYVRDTGRENLKLIAGDSETIVAQTVINNQERPISWIRIALKGLHQLGLNYIILDTAPSVGGIQERAIWAADLVIVPTATDYLSTDGTIKIAKMIATFQNERSWRGVLLGVLPTFYEERVRESQAALGDLQRAFGERVLQPIHKATILRECASEGKTIYEKDASCRAALEYRRLVQLALKA